MPEQDRGDAAGDSISAENFLLPWLNSMGPQATGDTLLHFRPSAGTSIDLTHAHPSGLAQLLAGRRTRLSTLLRDPVQYNAAKAAARALRAKIFELGTERGIDVGNLAAGTASWRSVDDAGRSETLNAPVLLTAVSLTVHSSQDDYELQITEQARLNPALVRHLRTVQGIDVDADALARLAYGTARLDPYPVLERLRQLADGVRGMSVEHRILVSTFADLAKTADDPAVHPGHPALAALVAAAREGDRTGGAAPAFSAAEGFPPLDERSPGDELLILDADSAQQEVLDQIGAGTSLVVSTPPGTGQTQTALNAAALLASQGKRVLIVAERRGTLNEFVQDLDALGLGSLALQVGESIPDGQLKDAVVRAIVRNEKAAEPSLASLHQTLVGHRHQLLEHVQSLHNIRSRWACSPYQAMQSLAGLTALDPAPSTTVRLKRSVLDSIPDRAELTLRLQRAAELGSFSKAATRSPWYGAQLFNRNETEHAYELSAGLARDLPELRAKVLHVAEYSNIALGATFTAWGEQLDLLVAVRASLDKFTPDIFDRPVTDLISATAPSSWRREHSIEMSSMTRSRLRRVAKEYVRPGVHIADLHSSLVDVQQQHTLWTQYATTEQHPSVPTGLAELNSSYQAVQARLSELTGILRTTQAGLDLPACGLDDLERILAELVADKGTLQTLPERTLLLKEMRERGLGDLLDALAEREVDRAEVGPELELAWWQSALEAMISGDDYLAMSDGDSLRRLELEYRSADSAHIASGASRLRWNQAQRWKDGIAAHPEDAGRLRSSLRENSLTLGLLAELSPTLVSALLPVWAVSPLLVPAVLPAGMTFDAVLVLDGESVSLQSVVPSVARARQVVVFGDEQLAAPSRFSIEIESSSRPGASDPLPSAIGAFHGILPARALTEVYRAVDRSLGDSLSESFYDGKLSRLPQASEISGHERGLVVEYLPNGTGMPRSDDDGVESVAVEVNRAVDLVFEHIRHRPDSSLAVVTASTRHAARVGEAIRLQMADYPWAAGFFAPGRESFRVVPVDRAAGLVRDDIIFSLGFGRTPHGRALHGFGPLSAPDGRQHFVMAMTRARSRLHVLTCFQPSDLDPTRLVAGALDFFELLQRELGESAETRTTPSSPSNADPLVADLVDRLRSRGAEVWDHYDGVLDIAAVKPAGGTRPGGRPSAEAARVPLAVESDGTSRYGARTVRERSRLRPQLLERMGWNYMPLWTIEVFTDPDGCARRAAEILALDPVDTQDALRRNESGQRPEQQEALLPALAAEDDARQWGDRAEDRDSWLREQRPPHWD